MDIVECGDFQLMFGDCGRLYVFIRKDDLANQNLKGALHMEFPFYDPPDTATIVCCHVFEGKPILYVSHDEDDGMWQFLCGSIHYDINESKLVSLKYAFSLDHSIGALKDMPCGYYAERKTKNDNWIIKKR